MKVLESLRELKAYHVPGMRYLEGEHMCVCVPRNKEKLEVRQLVELAFCALYSLYYTACRMRYFANISFPLVTRLGRGAARGFGCLPIHLAR